MPNFTAVPIQLALQGGGAKLVHLIAALDAVQDLQAEKRLHVTRIAGTSAGAIAGALFAAGESMSALRNELKMIPRATVDAIFNLPALPIAAWRIIRNQAIWPLKHITHMLNSKFGNKTLAELSIPLLPISADVRDRRAYLPPDTTSIVNALLDSSGIPFLFRTVPNVNAPILVDGGICENLPSDFLRDHIDTFGSIIGISFSDASAGATPTNAFKFGAALLDTAITNSVLRAQRSLKSRILAIPTTLGTFDFGEALSEGLTTQYDLIKIRAAEFFERIESEVRAEVNNELWEQPAIELLETIHDIYEMQHTDSYRVFRKSICVRASSLDDNSPHALDETTYKMVFAPSTRDIYCTKVTLNSALTAEFWGTYITVRNGRGESVPFKKIPLLDAKVGQSQREVLVYFTPPLHVGDTAAEPYELIVHDKIKDSMSELRHGRLDYLKTHSGRVDGLIDEIDLVLYSPFVVGPLKMLAECDCPNEKLTQAALKLYDAPGGFDAAGWRFYKVPDNAHVRLNFIPE